MDVCPYLSLPAGALTAATYRRKQTKTGRQLRDARDKFGRNITKVRHALTDEDRVPLPTSAK